MAHTLYAILGILIAFATLVVGWLTLRKKEAPDAVVKDSLLEHSSVATGNINQVYNEIGVVNVHHTPNRQSEFTTPEERKLPNIKFTRFQPKDVYVGAYQSLGISDSSLHDLNQVRAKAVVLKFENQTLPGLQIGQAMNVIAKLVLQSEDRTREHAIDYGVWTNSASNCTSIGVGETSELVLVCDIDGELVALGDRRTGRYFDETFSYFEQVIFSGFSFVEVTVIEQMTQVTLRYKFKVWRQGDGIGVAQM
jgi:hypothetical protein